MSYARWGYEGSDVYVYSSSRGRENNIVCCGCQSDDKPYEDEFGFQWPGEFINFEAYSTQEMVEHLAQHRAEGRLVPDGIEELLWADDARNFPEA